MKLFLLSWYTCCHDFVSFSSGRAWEICGSCCFCEAIYNLNFFFEENSFSLYFLSLDCSNIWWGKEIFQFLLCWAWSWLCSACFISKSTEKWQWGKEIMNMYILKYFCITTWDLQSEKLLIYKMLTHIQTLIPKHMRKHGLQHESFHLSLFLRPKLLLNSAFAFLQ